MAEENKRRLRECRCGSGAYCSLHRRYGIDVDRLREFRDTDDSDRSRQRCGGGYRILNKSIK